jgi:hypothetical protein
VEWNRILGCLEKWIGLWVWRNYEKIKVRGGMGWDERVQWVMKVGSTPRYWWVRAHHTLLGMGILTAFLLMFAT